MKRDKKWLIREITKLPCEVKNGYHLVRLVDTFPLIDQLDEPEKVVIPQFVADWIEESKKENYNLYQSYGDAPGEVDDWLYDHNHRFTNTNTFARAWLDYPNIEVEKEPLYYVLDKHRVPFIINTNGRINKSYTERRINDSSTAKERYQFTEREIKDYDERYWPFAVPVEEE